ncbi:MAG: hypothetical protein KF773_13715 [Deltaproteobacteria bacterium]|nr:hypothetical protein [Deltaproteobacteria bacterium]MCW5806008.1 hypothetical protein [Deltaproteobacteria bacterium]
MTFMDHALARRLERAESAIGTSFIEVRKRVTPLVGATWCDFDGTYALFDGFDSPMTQTFGLGLHAEPTPDAVAAIETYFGERGAPSMHEISSLAPTPTIAMLVERGYRPIDQSMVLVQPLVASEPAPSPLHIRTLERHEHAAWIDASVVGWSQDPQFSHVVRELSEVAVENPVMTHFLVESDGEMIATGSLGVHEDVALLAGASTIPSGRGRGAQNLLLATRLAEAHRRGCRLALMITAPGSTSQRNAERRGFRVAYARTKWRRDLIA